MSICSFASVIVISLDSSDTDFLLGWHAGMLAERRGGESFLRKSLNHMGNVFFGKAVRKREKPYSQGKAGLASPGTHQKANSAPDVGEDTRTALELLGRCDRVGRRRRFKSEQNKAR